ncbi:MAG: TadE/TadG family type IV pilus assembly protein [Sphingomicrobium sp.]
MMRLLNLRADERGAAIIELALVAPVLALMTIGVVDMSNAYSRKLALEQGAQRAIEKIMQTTEIDTVEGTLKTEAVCQVNGTNTDGTCKTSPITISNVTVTYRLECTASGGGITSQTNTDSVAFDALTCPGGTVREARYIEANVTDKYTPMFPIHFLSWNSDGTYHLQATAGMRTQ